MNENSSLNEEVISAQENLRLSANTVAKLNNELKIVCNENEEYQRRLKDAGDVQMKVNEYENKLGILSQEIERLNMVLQKKNQEIGNLMNELQEL